jgi:high-affinity iron transporter
VTEWLLILLACGLSAQAAGYLIAADVLPPLVSDVWDSSAFLPEDHIIGQIFHALFGYTDRPTGMQLVFYFSTLGLILTTMRILETMQKKTLNTAPSAVINGGSSPHGSAQ